MSFNKRAPRQQDSESSPTASYKSPYAQRNSPISASRASPGPQSYSSTPRGFAGTAGSPARTAPGTVLYVDSVASATRSRGGAQHQQSAWTRSKTSSADAHIKEMNLHMTTVPYRTMDGRDIAGGTAAFNSKSPSDRDSHMRDLMGRTYANPSSPTSPNYKRQLASASFRSASPNACAHIKAVTKPVDAVYDTYHAGSPRAATAAFRSTLSQGDAHIKAVNKFGDGVYQLSPASKYTMTTASFKSTTSIGDAHIKAVPKMADLCVAYRE
jgi:hypothetical protein